jgi:uncharacterized membrane protein HdeD (DUF308 family)
MDHGNWLVLRGCLFIVLGVAAMLFPTSAVFAFAMVFAAFAFVDGLLSVLSGAAGFQGKEAGRWPLIFRGLVGVLVGALFVLMPYVATASYALVSLTLLAVWAVFTGALEIKAAVRLRHEIRGEWLLGLSGLLSILLGLAVPIFLALYPAATLISAAWMIAIYAFMAGGALIVQGVTVKRRHGITTTEVPGCDAADVAAAQPAA